jgi:general stress protein 26
MADTDTHEHLYDLVKDFDTAMLVTKDASGKLHGRPMSVAELRADADAYFATSLESPKINEIEANPEAMITFQSGSQFASISGTARVVRDRTLIDRLWSEAWRAWFPGGKDDPTLCLIKLEAREGEYWDNSGHKGARYLFEGVKAIFQGEKHDVHAGEHAKVRL